MKLQRHKNQSIVSEKSSTEIKKVYLKIHIFFWITFITIPIKFWEMWFLCAKQTQIKQRKKQICGLWCPWLMFQGSALGLMGWAAFPELGMDFA